MVKIALIVLGIISIGISLYFTFSPESKTKSNSGQAAPAEPQGAQKSTQSSSSDTKSQSVSSWFGTGEKKKVQKNAKSKNANAKSKAVNAKSKTANAKSKAAEMANDNNYLTCGIGIQNCPPPKPAGKCTCNASQSLFTYFDGSH